MRRRSNLDNDRTDQDLHERPTCRNDFKRPSRLRAPLILADGTSLQISIVITIWLCPKDLHGNGDVGPHFVRCRPHGQRHCFLLRSGLLDGIEVAALASLNWAVKYAQRIHTVSR
jgi:hypothetical protein